MDWSYRPTMFVHGPLHVSMFDWNINNYVYTLRLRIPPCKVVVDVTFPERASPSLHHALQLHTK